MSQHKAEVPRIQAGGLVTVAFLKARLDEGSDHLGIFLPLVLNAVERLSRASFTTAEVQESLAATHKVAMPQETVTTLLKRATRGRYLLREAGRYRLNPGRPLPASDVISQKEAIELGQRKLGEALRRHAAKRGLELTSIEAALEALFGFLEQEQVALLLSGVAEHPDRSDAPRLERAVIAEFVHDAIRDDPALVSVLSGMLEGLVLYHAAFLPELATTNRNFRDLRVVFDSVLVRQALGYEGLALQTLLRETISLFKASGVQCLVLDKSVQEIRRILSMYEEKLATSAGRSSLWPLPMTRHFLTKRYSPGDAREMSALLDREIVAIGLQVLTAPRHTKPHTAGEKALAKRLADPAKRNEFEPRVVHDVDCIAAVLTLRKGHRAHSVDDARAVFVTSAPMVIRNTRLWWEEDEGEVGIPPVLHVRALANFAWLKKPSLCTDFKIRELVALCGAALRPKKETWQRFLRHLGTLESSKKLTSDEATSIVVSAMSDRLLREAENDGDDSHDIDAVTLDEIVDRVKASYRVKADERVLEIETDFGKKLQETEARERAALARAEIVERSTAEQLRRRDLAMEGRARLWARNVTRVIQGLVAAAVICGAVALIVGHPLQSGLIGIVVGGAIVIFVALELIGILRHVSEWRTLFEVRLTTRFRAWLDTE